MLSPVSDSGQALPTLSARVVIGGLVGLVALVYLPTLRFGFIYDDGWTILSNGYLRNPSDLGLLWSPEAAQRNVPDAFRPTLVAFDAGIYQLIGTIAPLHHAVSVLLHVGVCLVLERWLKSLNAPLPIRASTVAVFGLLAIHAEVVTVVSFREDLLAALFGLLGAWVASRSLDGSKQKLIAGLLVASACMALAGGAKASAAALPGFWLLVEWASPWRERRNEVRLLATAAVLQACALLTFVQNHVVYGSWSPYDPANNPRVLASRIPTSDVLAASSQIHLDYLQQSLLPFGLSPEHVDFGASWTDPSTLLACVVLLGIAGAGAWGLRRGHAVLAISCLGWLWLCVPTSNVFGLPNMQADRFAYLPSLAICVGASVGLLALGRRASARWSWPLLVWLPVAAFTVTQGAMAQATSTVYASNANLWTIAVQRAPGSARAQAMFGLTTLRQTAGRELADSDVLSHVQARCRRAEEIDPEYELPQLCFARLALARRDWKTAHESYARALERSPDRNDRSLAALAQLSLDRPDLSTSERRELAFGYLARGLREYPYSPELKTAAGRITHRIGQPWLALYFYRGARRLRPERWETVLAGLELALDLGDAAAARRTWLQAHELVSRADPATRSAISARLADAQKLYPAPLLQSLLSPGVFPDGP
jgi:tetratricopeptide (TPR) repeat protein